MARPNPTPRPDDLTRLDEVIDEVVSHTPVAVSIPTDPPVLLQSAVPEIELPSVFETLIGDFVSHTNRVVAVQCLIDRNGSLTSYSILSSTPPSLGLLPIGRRRPPPALSNDERLRSRFTRLRNSLVQIKFIIGPDGKLASFAIISQAQIEGESDAPTQTA